MIGHYIEDDALDALSLTGMLNGEGGISLTTSTSLNDFGDWLSGGDLDFVLVDIHRPDSLSFEGEIKRIRAHSSAPVFFITGDEAKFYLSDALSVGANGVLEKENLTPECLIEVLGNIPNQGLVEAEGGLIEDRARKPVDINDSCAVDAPDPVRFDPERFIDASCYLDRTLRAAAALPADGKMLSQTLGAIADAHILLEAYARGQSGLGRHKGKPVPQVIRHLQRASLALAKQRGVKLVFQTTASIFDEATAAQSDTAIRYALSAVMMGAPKGTTVRFNGLGNADGVRLSISSDAPLPFNVDDIIARKFPEEPAHLGPTVLMTSAAMLLGLDTKCLTVFQRGGSSTILIDIQDG